MSEMITYRLSAPGIWLYEFCLGQEQFGRASFLTSPSEPARMAGPDLDWYSPFDIDAEIAPVTSRRILDSATGEEVYRIVFWQPGLYEVRAKEKSIQVTIRDGCYLFGAPGMPVTARTEKARGEPILIRGQKAEPCFRTEFLVSASPRYMMMVLSFPALRFC